MTEPRASEDPEPCLHGRSLAALQLLDAPPQECFDRLTRIAARLLGVPLCLLSLIEGERGYLLSQVGLGEPWASARETPLSHLFREHLAGAAGPLVVVDARLDERLAGDPATAELGAVAYAAVPVTYAGRCAGWLLAADFQPRQWSAADLDVLRDIAAIVAGELERRGALLERDRALATLRDSEEHMRLSFDAAAIGMVMVSLAPGNAGRIVRVNEAFCEFLGHSEESLLGAHIDEITHPEDRRVSNEALAALANGSQRAVRRLEKRYLHARGSTVWGSLTTSAVTPLGGGSPYVISLVEDINERKQSELDLPAIASVLRRILSGEDARGGIVQAAVDIAGASSAHLIERSGPDTLTATASAGLNLRGVDIQLSAPSATASVYLTGKALFLADPVEDPLVSRELLELARARSIMWQPILSHSDVIGVLCVCWAERVSDVCARSARAVALLTDETAVALAHRDALEQLAAQATTDGLTGLPNRRAWDERMARELAAARRHRHPLTLALLDMDRFKHFNDTRGHAAGDELLREFASHARVLLREGDTLARWGGEEFAVLLPNCPSESFAESILDRIRTAVPGGQSCSVGYASWDGLESAEQLVGRADRALYRAKAMGRDRVDCADSAPDAATRSQPKPS